MEQETHVTQLQLELSRGAYKFAFILETIFTFFKKIIKAIQDGQQRRANEEIARLLKKEFPNETHEYILRYVEKGRINELHK